MKIYNFKYFNYSLKFTLFIYGICCTENTIHHRYFDISELNMRNME